MRVVLDDGSLPWSVNPSRSDASGMVAMTRTTNPPMANGQARRWTVRLQRCQPVSFVSSRCLRWIEILLMLRPAKPSMAGIKVSVATTMMSTGVAPAMAIPLMKSRPMMNMQSMEIMTAMPANTTAFPAVPMERTVASWGDLVFSSSRYRVTMNST